MKEQRIRDPIHNLVRFSQDDEILWRLLQTSWMQRLRRIKQLGFSDFVYPGASHTRFSHSLGALQMARRMLHVFESKSLIGQGSEQAEHQLLKKATLCAVLLHDVGHGPYSHIFENVSRSLGVKQTHEDYTKQIVSDDSEIKEIFSSHSEELHKKVIDFFGQESGSDQYSRIVSSQLDADRLDFLMRDRYFCGVRFGEIDLEWLLDSIVIKKISHPEKPDVNPYTFCFNEKGRTVAEDFVMAYINMYHNVYYHKAVDALKIMAIEILKGIYKEKNKKIWRQNDPLAEYFFSSDPAGRLDSYKNLDDSSVIEAIKWASSQTGLGRPHELSKRFLRRDIFKSIIIPENVQTRVGDFEEGLKAVQIWFERDIPKPKGIKFYPFGDEGFLKNLWIMKSETPVPLHAESDIVKNVKETLPIRFYFEDSDSCSKAIELADKIGMQL